MIETTYDLPYAVIDLQLHFPIIKDLFMKSR